MRFKTVTAMELSDLRERVEHLVSRLEGGRRQVIDVDFFVDNRKVFPYRAVIKYR